MPWFISAVLICLAFFALAYIASEIFMGRIGRSRTHRRNPGGEDQREQSLYDEIAHWENKPE